MWSRQPGLELWVVDSGRSILADATPPWLVRVFPASGLMGSPLEDGVARGREVGRMRPAQLFEFLVRGLLERAGVPVTFSLTRPTTEAGVDRVVVGCPEEDVARLTADAARALLVGERSSAPADLEATIAEIRALYQNTTLGPSTRAIVRAAELRGIPARRLSSGSLVLFGQGARQRRIMAAETDRTSAIAQEIAKDKELTRQLLRAIGAPVPEGGSVTTVEEACEAALEIGLPVVVKPVDGNQGRGVATNLRSRGEVEFAFQAALDASSSGQVTVEKFAEGDDYRVLVVGERVVAAARREPAHVIGDGTRTIAELVALENTDPRRGEDHATALNKIPLDTVSLSVLAAQGYSPGSIPPAGQKVLIRRNANLSTGGTATDVTEELHPRVAAQCIAAAKMVGLDVAGIDVVARSLRRPLEEQGGVIVEVNAAPGLRMHLEPSRGRPRPVGEAIVDLMFGPRQTGRIPVISITGVNGKTTVTRFIAHLANQTGLRVGMTCTDGVYVDDRRIELGDCSGPSSARSVLVNPAVEVAVLETARGGILRAGLGFDLCDVAVVTNIGGGDHLGISDVNTPEDLAWVKGTIVEAVAPHGFAVLNAADPLVAAMVRRCRGSVVFFARDGNHPGIVAHREQRGRAIFVRAGRVLLVDGVKETDLIGIDEVPLTHGGRVGFQIENTLAAAGAAWSAGFPLDSIRQGLRSFGAEVSKVPGRFNLLEIKGATVMFDYGHNPSALSAILEVIREIPCLRRLAVYSAAGDRRDEDMIAQGAMLAEHFDIVYLYEDQYMRGRASGDICAQFRKGMEQGENPRVNMVHELHDALVALESALNAAQPGDLLLIQPDAIDTTFDFLRLHTTVLQEAREVNLADRPRAGEVVLTEVRVSE
jgi:cyanophycin synthetase